MPVSYIARSSSCGVMISAPVGKSGPCTCLQSSRGVASGSSSRWTQAATTSRRLCGGMSVAMPTAMPVRAVQQHVRQARRQQLRLLERAVEVRLPVDRALAELGQQHVRVGRQPRLGVAHRREGLRIVGRAPVALAVDDRIAVRERLRHQHHRLVAGGVAVRMELADHVADRARRLLVLGAGGEAELAHRVDDAALHGLQAVAELRQRAIEDHVHRVVEVRLLGEGREAAAARCPRSRVGGCSVSCSDRRQVALGLEPVAPVGGALLREQHVHQLVGAVLRLDR